MLDGLVKYDSYRDSGIPWLTEVPTEWDIQRAKWLFHKMDRPVRPEDDVVTAFRDGEVTLRTNRRTEGFTNAIQEHGYQGIRKGDLVIHAMDAFAGAIGVSDSEGKSTPVYAACVPRGIFDVSPRYYAYALRFVALSGYILSLAKGIRERSTDFRFKDFGEMEMPVPDLYTQNRIVKFLDEKTAEIDAAVAKKRRLIDLLNEQKAILINRAVTKGLNPAAPMRDSGADWIGEMPAHWDVKRVKHVAQVSPSKTGDNVKRTDLPAVFLPMEAISTLGEIDQSNVRPTREMFEGLTYFQKGDVVVAKITPCFENGKGAWLDNLETDYGFGTTELHVLRPRKVHGRFLHLLLSRKNFLLHGEEFMEGSAGQKRVPTDFIANYLFGMPPNDEQIEIANLCSVLSADFRTAIGHQNDGIATLNEFKQTLIANVVTGKIKI